MIRDLSALVANWLVKGAGPHHRYFAAKEPLDIAAAAILFPRARFVHVIRDGRDVALSMRHASETWDPSMGVHLPMGFRAEAWRKQVENIRAHRVSLGERYLEIRYEDMLEDVRAAARTLFDFACVPYDDALLTHVKESTDLTAVTEVAQRSGFRGGSRREGRRRLTKREERAFRRAAGDLLIELGYG